MLLRNLLLVICFFITANGFATQNSPDPLPSWNAGTAKNAILHFVQATTNKTNPSYIPPEQRIVTFDQDGTVMVEYPLYAEGLFSFNQVKSLASKHPEWKSLEPFKSVINGDKQAIAKFTEEDLKKIIIATQSGSTIEGLQVKIKQWLAENRDPRWHRRYTELVYQPMLEVMQYLRANGYKTYIVTGSDQVFVRVYSEHVFGIPPEQIIGSTLATQYKLDSNGQAQVTLSPKFLLYNNYSCKPEEINLMIGRRPCAAFGNSTGDRSMLEFVQSGRGNRLMFLVLHDDSQREYAYGPARGLPHASASEFTESLYQLATKNGWIVISMKNDWKRMFAFDKG